MRDYFLAGCSGFLLLVCGFQATYRGTRSHVSSLYVILNLAVTSYLVAGMTLSEKASIPFFCNITK